MYARENDDNSGRPLSHRHRCALTGSGRPTAYSLNRSCFE